MTPSIHETLRSGWRDAANLHAVIEQWPETFHRRTVEIHQQVREPATERPAQAAS